MAEDTPTTAVPAAEAGETPVERAPDAEHKPAAADSAPAATTTEEQSAEKANGPEEKTSGKDAVQYFYPFNPMLSLVFPLPGCPGR